MTMLNLIKNLKMIGVELFVEDGKLKAHNPDGSLTAKLSEEIKANKDDLISLLLNKKNGIPDHAKSAISFLSKQDGVDKVLPFLDTADKISARSFAPEERVDVSADALGNHIIIDLKSTQKGNKKYLYS